MPSQKRTYRVYAWFSKRKTYIGFGYQNGSGPIRIKANDHFDTAKLGRALIKGIDLELRDLK